MQYSKRYHYINLIIEKNSDLKNSIEFLERIKEANSWKYHVSNPIYDSLNFLTGDNIEIFKSFKDSSDNNFKQKLLTRLKENLVKSLGKIDKNSLDKDFNDQLLKLINTTNPPEKINLETITDKIIQFLQKDNPYEDLMKNLLAYNLAIINFTIAEKTIEFIKEASDQELEDCVKHTKEWVGLNKSLYLLASGQITEKEFTLSQLCSGYAFIEDTKLHNNKITSKKGLKALKNFRYQREIQQPVIHQDLFSKAVTFIKTILQTIMDYVATRYNWCKAIINNRDNNQRSK
jgi:hypothetical protein